MRRAKRRRTAGPDGSAESAAGSTSGETMSAAAVRWERLSRSLLFGGKGAGLGVAGVARHVAGVQAQSVVPAALAVWNRTGGACSLARFREEVFRRGAAAVRVWGPRGTLHVLHGDDWPAVAALVGPKQTRAAMTAARSGRLIDAGGEDAEEQLRRARDHVAATLLKAPHRATRESLADAGLDQRLRYRSFMLATYGGHGCLVQESDGATSELAGRAHWLGAGSAAHAGFGAGGMDEAAAARALAARYFAAFGPAEAGDFAFWAGCGMREARAAAARLVEDGELAEVPGRPGVFRQAGDEEERDEAAPPPDDEWPVRLLGRFDATLLAHRDKGWVVDEAWRRAVWSKNADIVATILVGGRVAGTWSHALGAGGVSFTLRPFGAALAARAREAAEDEARRMAGTFFELPFAGCEEAVRAKPP